MNACTDQFEVFPSRLRLMRVAPNRTTRYFYRLHVERDLFGGASLVQEWGRVGTRGRSRAERFPDEGHAVTALMQVAATLKQRGYGPDFSR
ncbi:WGR domain-containing protein [Alloyangia pacifica]|uniref:WGR domain-containing protein n=1 Tax=Alloyangia pacifica TaxID=311180 RepID=UPI001CD74B38|nr:WGR domain-containing protein [Alloyangia pacifica]MCA0996668.1 WGR domain-containing protein [Alloyangia pacifica]